MEVMLCLVTVTGFDAGDDIGMAKSYQELLGEARKEDHYCTCEVILLSRDFPFLGMFSRRWWISGSLEFFRTKSHASRFILSTIGSRSGQKVLVTDWRVHWGRR